MWGLADDGFDMNAMKHADLEPRGDVQCGEAVAPPMARVFIPFMKTVTVLNPRFTRFPAIAYIAVHGAIQQY